MVRPKSQESLFEQRLEAKNQTFNSIDKLMERWQERITIRNLQLADRFVNFELHLLLHLFIKDTSEMWGACFEPIILSNLSNQPIGEKQIIMRNGKEGAVLVDVVKLVESPEQIIPTLVWFEPIDSFYRFLPHALYFSSLRGFVSSEILSNGKFDTTGRFLAGANEHKLEGEMVESTPKIVDDIASSSDYINRNSGQSNEFRISHVRELKCPLDVLAGLQVVLASNYCNVLGDEKVGCQITEVLFGPLNFYADKNDSIACFQRHVP